MRISRPVPALLIGLFFVTLAAQEAAAAIPGFARVNYTTPLDPTGLATADLNGDGFPDLAVGCQSDPNPVVSVFLGNGDGTLGPRTDNATGLNPVRLVEGDFNRDGRTDIAACIHITGRVAVLLGRGDGTFARAVEYPVGAFPEGIATADFNEDGKLDLATTDYQDGTLSILLGNGNGTFQVRRVVSAGSSPSALASGDVNGDGHQDLVDTDFVGSEAVLTFLGHGDGTFTTVTYAAVPSLSGLALADLNGDGRLDVALADHDSNTFTTLLGVGDGSFSTEHNYSVAGGPSGIAVGDLDGDGHPDIAVTSIDAGTVSLFAGVGDGTFTTAGVIMGVTGAISVAVADWNKDNHPDLVAAAANANSVAVLISLAGDLPARGFVAGNDKTIKLGTNTPWCAQAEPIGGDFALTDITPGSIELVSPGTGTVSRISASGATTIGDRDGNGVQDLTACFDKTSLRALFSSIRGKQNVVVRVAMEGTLTGGRRFHAPFSVTVAPAGGMMAAAFVVPSRDRGSGILNFVTARPGIVSVGLYDVSGRLVARALDRTWLPAGGHAVPMHTGLASGVYLYRIETSDGVASGRTLVVK